MNKSFLRTLVAILALSFFACVSGPKQDKKSVGNYLSGEHYKQTASVMGVPVIERVVVQTIISGKILPEDPLALIPKGVEVQLLRAQSLVGTEKTAADGSFRFAGDYKNGDYLLKIQNRNFQGSQIVSVHSYELRDIQLLAKKIQK